MKRIYFKKGFLFLLIFFQSDVILNILFIKAIFTKYIDVMTKKLKLLKYKNKNKNKIEY